MSKTYHPPLLGNPRIGFRFGQLYPRNPIFGSLQGQRHLGQDYLVPIGTPVYAIDNGTLAYSEGRQGGITVNLVTDDGLSVRYMHLSRYADKSKTRAVRGEIIAYSGNTGVSNSGGHLHADIYNGRITIPTRFAMFIDPLSLKYSTEQPTINKPNNNEDMTDKEIKVMLTAIARQYNKGDIFDPKKGSWIDIDHYVRMYKDTPQKDLVIDRLYANIDDIKVKQGINLLDARTRNWRK
jgi:murein DD-endopeptidase MepM/ murein hydrolase activator NlpD